MDVPRDYQTKGSKSEKDKHHMILLIHGIFKQTNKKKRVQMNLFTQQKKKKNRILHIPMPCGWLILCINLAGLRTQIVGKIISVRKSLKGVSI